VVPSVSVATMKGDEMKVGIIGWRGMVGSVLMDRMRTENDFSLFEATFFSTSQIGESAPSESKGMVLLDAFDNKALAEQDIIVTCQGGAYTEKMHSGLRDIGWKGYWIDAASTLRLSETALIALDPVNGDMLRQGIASGVKDFVGGNCTVSLMLLALHGLFKQGLVEWVSSMTYQAASGAGVAAMSELLDQMKILGNTSSESDCSLLETDVQLVEMMNAASYPCSEFGVALAGNLIPWIDSAVEHGQTREEWKGQVEAQKILGEEIPIDGICVRVGAMRCHSQAFTIKLRRPVDLTEVEELIEKANPWVQFVENTKEATLARLTPAAVSGSLHIPVGRVRSMKLGPDYLSAFTVGDQLLWGAAEPLRRILRILIEELN